MRNALFRQILNAGTGPTATNQEMKKIASDAGYKRVDHYSSIHTIVDFVPSETDPEDLDMIEHEFYFGQPWNGHGDMG